MSIIITATLMILGIVAAIAFVVGVVAVIGLISLDVSTWGKREKPAVASVDRATEDAERRIFLERGFARTFVIAGGLFWGIAAFAGLFSFRESGMTAAFLAAFVPFAASMATLILGWYYERFTSGLLAIASAAVVVWGVMYQFEMGVWVLVSLFLIAPMATASVLFWMARRDQVALDLRLANAGELAPVATKS